MKTFIHLFIALAFLSLSSCSQAQQSSSLEEYQVDVHSDSIKAKLSKEQQEVLCGGATEPPFTGEYVYHKEDGIYHCAACNAPLFSSETKYESGSGWPSFYDMIDEGSVATKPDYSHGMVRTEIVCATCGGHLGHVFKDGPNPTGLRYCVNSVSLSFEGDTTKANK